MHVLLRSLSSFPQNEYRKKNILTMHEDNWWINVKLNYLKKQTLCKKKFFEASK